MPLPSSRGERARMRGSQRHEQPWVVPAALLALAALVGPLDPISSLPTPVRIVAWIVALGLAWLAVVRWFDLQGLTRWNVFILVASYVFYGNYNWHFVGLLAISTIANQVFTTNIDRNEEERKRKAWLILAVTLNLGVLGWFKYKGFFIESGSSLFSPLGIDIVPPARAIIPPVGISFFTFQALSYVIDTYRRKLHPVPLLEFAVYLSFFPHLVAGPIVRASEFLPQLRVPRDVRRLDTGLAFWLIAAGMFKKVVVSSYLASASVDPVFRLPSQHDAGDTLVGIYAYAIQIYCDFSGYTDMAIGLALLLGFRFPQNFDAPYTSASLQEFWRRWHMTLSRWLRDYVYIPLGGNQRGTNRAILNVFLTMVIGGLWHGAAWTFVVWGAIHGTALAAERVWADRPKREGARQWSPTAQLWFGRFLTFQIVCLGWVFFRAPTLTDAFHVLGRLLHPGLGKGGINLLVVAIIATFILTQYVPSKAVSQAQAVFSRMAVWQQGTLLALSLAFTSALAPVGVAPFIYFAF